MGEIRCEPGRKDNAPFVAVQRSRAIQKPRAVGGLVYWYRKTIELMTEKSGKSYYEEGPVIVVYGHKAIAWTCDALWDVRIVMLGNCGQNQWMQYDDDAADLGRVTDLLRQFAVASWSPCSVELCDKHRFRAQCIVEGKKVWNAYRLDHDGTWDHVLMI